MCIRDRDLKDAYVVASPCGELERRERVGLEIEQVAGHEDDPAP